MMRLNEVPASQGYVWFRQGVWLFRRSPLTFMLLLFVYAFFVQFGVLLPLIGIIAILVMTPAIVLGFMDASRETIRGQRVTPLILIDGYRKYGSEVRKNLLKLGGMYAAAVLLLSLIASSTVDVRELLPVLLEQETASPEAVRQLYFALLIAATLYTPVAMLMWFAPMLVAWHEMPPAKALFASWIACWRNRGAFATFVALWAVLLIAVPMMLRTLLDALGASGLGGFIVKPYSLIMLAVLYCSFYATWRGCYQTDTDAAPPEA